MVLAAAVRATGDVDADGPGQGVLDLHLPEAVPQVPGHAHGAGDTQGAALGAGAGDHVGELVGAGLGEVDDEVQVGRGYWVYMTDKGTLVP